MRRLDQRAELISAIVPPAVFLIVTALFLFTIGQVGQVFQVIVSLMVIPRSRSVTRAPHRMAGAEPLRRGELADCRMAEFSLRCVSSIRSGSRWPTVWKS